MSTPFIKRNLASLWVLALLIILMVPSCNRNIPSSAQKPEDNRFTLVTLTTGFDEPMEMTFLPDHRVLIVERKGDLKSVDLETNKVTTIAHIPVNTKYTTKDGRVTEAEEGLVGIVAHPDFAKNHWIYMYYADPDTTQHVLARWELHGDSLYESTKKVLLKVHTQREVCCHTGGGMAWDKEGNLYLTVGNNTANPPSGIASYDERPGRSSWDDQRGSGNTNDLRGSILRIHPEDDGTYTIPDGNLFPKGTPKTRPEIYIKGDRNPWRVSVDSKTGWIYWGEVGPDASVDSIWGTRGYDEFNQAKKPGYYGWPYFVGNNQAYHKYNYVDSTYAPEPFDPEHPVNNSPNNTGITNLPPAHPALIWYPYAASDTFPLLGTGGRSAVGGPIFHEADFKDAPRPWPAYFENKWLITDFMRGWLMSVTLDEDGNYKSMEQILPDQNFSSVIDMKFSPDGDLYFLEYGSAWFQGNANSALVRVEYNGGNRKPNVEATADHLQGALPLAVKLSSAGTKDFDSYDSGKLKYEWKVTGNGMNQTFTDPNPSLTLDKAGYYDATLTVTDTKGESNSKTLKLAAGNEPPNVNLSLVSGNKTFFFPDERIQYNISVSDKEDGSVASGSILPDLVAVNFDYVPQGFDPIEIAQNHRAADERTGFNAGKYLISTNDCLSCHRIDTTSIGPSYMRVATKYKGADNAKVDQLANKIIDGGTGVWGDAPMSAHPSISPEQATLMVKYILSLSRPATTVKSMPLKGDYTVKVPAGENGKGGFLLRAAYTDKGANSINPLSAESIIPLRSASVDPNSADVQKSTQLLTTPRITFSLIGDHSYIGYKNIDFTGIKQIEFLVQATPNSGDAGGYVEVHLDSPDGQLIGKTDAVVQKRVDFARIRELMGGSTRGNSNSKSSAGTKQQTTRPINFDLLAELMAQHAIAKLDPVSGSHSVYFVFVNPKADPTQSLMQVNTIKFENE